MHAYKKDLRGKCQTCGVVAYFEVFNAYNATMGKFCSRCADKEIERLRRIETFERTKPKR